MLFPVVQSTLIQSFNPCLPGTAFAFFSLFHLCSQGYFVNHFLPQPFSSRCLFYLFHVSITSVASSLLLLSTSYLLSKSRTMRHLSVNISKLSFFFCYILKSYATIANANNWFLSAISFCIH